ncbi:MAG: hypothetical protein IJ524_06385 [Bacteroidales bacterium]|nr:hypothetical protein [Bacteroidales bacterium]
MTNRRNYLCFITALCLVVISCNKNDVAYPSELYSSKDSNASPKETMVIGKKLSNPYSISNMQAAYDSLVFMMSGEHGATEQLEPNCLYVRFLPRDSAEIAILQDMDVELFDYPLDYEIEFEGDTYHDPDVPEDQVTWQYTTVSPDFVFPSIEYQILEQCYIPGLSEGQSSDLKVDPDELELLAIQIADLPEKYQPITESKIFGYGKKPEGTIKVKNDDASVEEALRGVKIRCHYFVNISSCYTDETGHYKIKNRYVCNPHYAIVFNNVRGFVIWGNYAFIAAASLNLGYNSNSGFSTTVQPSSSGWKWAVINNAAYDYYKQCAIEGIKTPPYDLRIWCWPDAASSSAPMLHHLFGVNNTGFTSQLISILISGTVTPAAAIISAAGMVVSMGLPDITIGMSSAVVDKSPNHGYLEHYHVVWHELTHASHFRQAGELVWGPYINYIVTHNGYGDGSETSVGRNICGLGESWAYANESIKAGCNPSELTNGWFFSGCVGIYNLLNNGILTRKQMYDCLTSDVKSISAFKAKLINKYPSKTPEINAQL